MCEMPRVIHEASYAAGSNVNVVRTRNSNNFVAFASRTILAAAALTLRTWRDPTTVFVSENQRQGCRLVAARDVSASIAKANRIAN